MDPSSSEQPAPKPICGQRFPRELRIVSASHFQRAYRQGARARGAILVVVAVENGLPHARLGLSVGRSVWKRAVPRNRVRRIFREAFRLSRADLPSGFDFVLIPAAPRLDPSLEGTRAELVRLARKAAGRQLEKRAAEGQAAPPTSSPEPAKGRPAS